MVAALTRDGNQFGGLHPGQARRGALDILARAVGAIVLSRACPDDSPLADEILVACRDEILAGTGQPPVTQKVRMNPASPSGPRKRVQARRKAQP